MKVRCGCVWLGVHCPNEATAEDGLCDWCAPFNARSDEQLRANPSTIVAPDGSLLLGGGGQVHDAPLAEREGFSGPPACWYEDSGRTIAPPSRSCNAPFCPQAPTTRVGKWMYCAEHVEMAQQTEREQT